MIGNPALFDIQQASVHIADNWATVTIYFEGTVSALPEPGMFPLLAGGAAMLAGFGALRRKRAQRLVRVSKLPS